MGTRLSRALPAAMLAGLVAPSRTYLSAMTVFWSALALLLFARFGGVEAYLWALFGRAHRSAAELAAANAALRTLRLTR